MITLPNGFDRQIERLSDAITLGQRREFRERKNVIGTGVGPKHVNGQRTDDVALVIFVEDKQPEHRLPPDDILPSKIVTDTGQTVTIDVEEATGGFTATSAPEPGQYSTLRLERYRPMPGGVSISRPGGPSGTASGLMWYDGDPVLLTARHVATVGTESTTGDPIHQPAYGLDPSAQPIGTTREHAPWWPGDTTRTSELDASLIDIDEEDASGEYLGTDRAASGAGRMDMDRRVVHIGYRAGIRSGAPRARDVEVRVNYDHFGGYIEYTELEALDGISASGSSGAMNLQIDYRTGEMTIIGMQIASTVNAEGVRTRSLHIPWRNIERHFDGLTPAN